MNALEELLGLAARSAREGSVNLPGEVLHAVLAGADVKTGALGRGEEVLAGAREESGLRRTSLPAGRESFWIALPDEYRLDTTLAAAAGLVLSTWQMREELKRARFAERRRLWEVESLRAISEALGGTLETPRIAEELLVHVAAMLDARRGEVWLLEERRLNAVARFNGAESTGPVCDDNCTVAARIGEEILTASQVSEVPDGGILSDSIIAVPVAGRRGRLGVLALAEREVRGGLAPFGETDLETLSLYATQAAVALENAGLHRESLERERLERELELAAAIQRQLLPREFPVLPGFEVLARTEPSRHVGGDIFDVMMSPKGLLLVLSDVAGKGVPAALMAASLHSALHLLARRCPPVDELTQMLHSHLMESIPDNKFATAFIGCIRPDGTLEYVSAGHNPVVLIAGDGASSLLGSTGPPLGLLPESRFEAKSVKLYPGSLLVAYTDGFTEAQAAGDGPDFGEERLLQVVMQHRHERLADIITALLDSVDEFTGNAPAHDDRTLLALRRLPNS